SEVDSHARVSSTVSIDGNTGTERHLFKLSSTFVVIKEFQRRVISHKDVRTPIAVVVRKCDPETFARLGYSDLLRDLGKVPISIVVINQWSNRLEIVGVTIGAHALFVLTAPHFIEIPIEVAQDHQVQQSIAIQIDPGRTGGPSSASPPRLLSHIRKGS